MEKAEVVLQELVDQQMNKCVEWVAFNLQPANQRPTNSQLEQMKKDCRILV